jgi:uncharacterized protein YbjT (DUF2867 family)
MINKIAVIGATGMLGKPVTRALAQNGFKITALVRDRLKANLPEGVNKLDGDVANIKSLERLLTGQDALYLNLSIKHHEKEKDFHTESEGLKNILAVARTKNLKRIVYLSSIVMRYQGMNGFHWWAFDIKQQAVQMIKESGIPYTIFYPSNFMDNFHTTYRNGNRILLSGNSAHKMWWVSAEDYAKQVVASLKTTAAENKDYVVQGPEAFTADEAAEIFIQQYPHAKLRISKAPLGLLKFLGRFSQKINYGYHVIEALNNYPEQFEAEDTWKDLGRASTTLRLFAKK